MNYNLTQPALNTNAPAPGQAPKCLPDEELINVIGRYLLNHPQVKKCFTDHEPKDIIRLVIQKLAFNQIRVAFDNKNRICGVLIFEANVPEMTIHVSHLIGHGQRIVDAALNAWVEEFPNFDVSVMRRGKIRYYKFDQFFQ